MGDTAARSGPHSPLASCRSASGNRPEFHREHESVPRPARRREPPGPSGARPCSRMALRVHGGPDRRMGGVCRLGSGRISGRARPCRGPITGRARPRGLGSAGHRSRPRGVGPCPPDVAQLHGQSDQRRPGSRVPPTSGGPGGVGRDLGVGCPAGGPGADRPHDGAGQPGRRSGMHADRRTAGLRTPGLDVCRGGPGGAAGTQTTLPRFRSVSTGACVHPPQGAGLPRQERDGSPGRRSRRDRCSSHPSSSVRRRPRGDGRG